MHASSLIRHHDWTTFPINSQGVPYPSTLAQALPGTNNSDTYHVLPSGSGSLRRPYG